MINQEPMRLVSPFVDVLREHRSGAQLDTQILFGEEVTFFLDDQMAGFTKVRTLVDQKIGWVANKGLHFQRSEDLLPATHRIAKPTALLYPDADYKTQPKATLSMNSLVTVLRTEVRGEREYAEIAQFRRDTAWVRLSALRPIDQPAPDFVAVAELFIGRDYGWGRRDAHLGVDCSAILHASMIATGRKACPRDSGEQATTLGEAMTIESLRQLRRGDLVFMPGHVLIMTGNVLAVHATERDPYSGVVCQPLQQVIQERQQAGDSCEISIRRFPHYPHQQLRKVA